jgi:structural maintenance of chromosome 1
MCHRAAFEKGLEEIHSKLSEAKADEVESENDKKKREVINQLVRTFNGVHGRLTELVKVTIRSYVP